MSDWVDRFAVWEGFHPDLQTLLIYGTGIAIYTALVFTFYQNISRRDPFHGRKRGGWWGKAKHTAETALTFPVLSFGYFTVLSLALFLMSKPQTETGQILLLSMAAVLGVRVTAHVSETMANDVAKLLPLSLLAVVLVDPGYLALGTTVARVSEAMWMGPVLLQYFVLFILVEAGLRAIRALFPAAEGFARDVQHRHRVSKRVMLRDIEGGHAHRHVHLGSPKHHEHGPRERAPTPASTRAPLTAAKAGPAGAGDFGAW